MFYFQYMNLKEIQIPTNSCLLSSDIKSVLLFKSDMEDFKEHAIWTTQAWPVSRW